MNSFTYMPVEAQISLIQRGYGPCDVISVNFSANGTTIVVTFDLQAHTFPQGHKSATYHKSRAFGGPDLPFGSR